MAPRKRNQRTAAQARRDRAALFKEIAREHKRADRARLEGLLVRLRAARSERRRAIAAARTSCARRRTLPTLEQLARELRAEKSAARASCSSEVAAAKKLRGDEARARAEHRAELAHQRTMRRIERGNAAKVKAAKARPGLAKIARSESDDEVRVNIPPELVFLFERVKRQIKGSDRMSRTEAFLKYAEEHPDEELAAIEDKTEAMIREHERMANPKKKAKKKAKGKRPTMAEKKKKRAAQRRRAKTRPPTKAERAEWEASQARLASVRKENSKLRAALKAKKNPHRPPARWFDACLASVAGQRHARDPAAICGAAWWNQPVAKRRAIVRRLERGSSRDRRFAVGIAKAEQRRHDRAHGARKKNPGPPPRELYALSYVEQKAGDRKPHVYEHVFEGRRPRVVMRGGKLALVGGSQFTKDGWIHG